MKASILICGLLAVSALSACSAPNFHTGGSVQRYDVDGYNYYNVPQQTYFGSHNHILYQQTK